jgi:hypothetical protein
MQPEKFSQYSYTAKGWPTEELYLIPVKDKKFFPLNGPIPAQWAS